MGTSFHRHRKHRRCNPCLGQLPANLDPPLATCHPNVFNAPVAHVERDRHDSTQPSEGNPSHVQEHGAKKEGTYNKWDHHGSGVFLNEENCVYGLPGFAAWIGLLIGEALKGS